MSNEEHNRILVIDRPGVERMLICHYLEGHDLDIASADSFEDAFTAMRSTAYDLLVLDTFGEAQNGLEFIRKARRRFNRYQLPIILVTSTPTEELEADSFEAGANDFIAKPIQPQGFLGRIIYHLKLHLATVASQQELHCLREALVNANEGAWNWDFTSQSIIYSDHFIHQLDPDGRHKISNSPQEWLGRIHPEDRESVNSELQRHLRHESEYFTCQYRLISANNVTHWVLTKGCATFDEEGRAQRMAGTTTDVSTSLTFDNVTHLPDRHILCDWLTHIKAYHVRTKEQPFALLVIAIDNYESWQLRLDTTDLNNLLATVAQRIKLCLRATDLVARLGQFQFGCVVTHLHGISSVLKIANRLQSYMESPINLSSQDCQVSISIGISFSSSRYEYAEDMVNDGVRAANQAQEQETQKIRIADEELAALSQQRLLQEIALETALNQNRLVLSFTPVYNAATGKPHSLRVNLNELNGERYDKVGDYHQWSDTKVSHKTDSRLLMATLTETEQLSRFPHFENSFLSIPVQGLNLSDGDLFKFIENELPDIYHNQLDYICLEINEDALAQHRNQINYINRKLRLLGLNLGLAKCGLNSISPRMLEMLPIRYLKLSPNFTDASEHHTAMLRLAKTLAKELNIELIATGINTDALSRLALSKGIVLQQGNLFGEQLSLAKFPASINVSHSPIATSADNGPGHRE